jgi:hypothetical protein
MSSSGTATTLYDDWQQRRGRLVQVGGADNPLQVPHMKVLDYLLHRYQGSPEGQRPARFRLHTKLHWDDRRILVHQHLGGGKVGGVKSQEEAEERVVSVLERMTSPDEDPDRETIADELDEQAEASFKKPLFAPRVMKWASFRRSIRWGIRPYRMMRAQLRKDPYLPPDILQHLENWLSDVLSEDEWAWELLCMCRNHSALDHALAAWRRRVADGPADDQLRKDMEDFFCEEERRELVAEKMREHLAHENSAVRLASTRILADIGELQDIGLLSDLLSLPESADEQEQERPALIEAMRRIAESR